MEKKYLGTESRIFYKKNKFDPKRSTLVFVHGLAGSSSAWIPYENKFKKYYNLLSFDLRGNGKSFRPKKFEDYSMEKSANDLYLLLRHEKIFKCILISHSFGNLVVLEFLRKHQNMVTSAIFVSPHYAPSKRELSRMIVPLFLLAPLLNLSRKEEGGHVDYSSYKNVGDWDLKLNFVDAKNTGLKSYINLTEHSYYFDAEDLLKKIKIPVLIIHGRKDTIFPVSHAEKMSKQIKNSKMIILNGANHLIPLNDIEKLSKLIKGFVENQPKGT